MFETIEKYFLKLTIEFENGEKNGYFKFDIRISNAVEFPVSNFNQIRTQMMF